MASSPFIRWIIDRCEGRVDARETAIGHLPNPDDIDVRGLDVSAQTLGALLAVDPEQWRVEIEQIREYLEGYGERLPEELTRQCEAIAEALGGAAPARALQSSTA